MIDFPNSKEAFAKLFATSALFHCKNYNFSQNNSKDKFLLVLSGRDESGQSHFYLPTSQVDKYMGNPLFSDSIFIFPENAISQFPKKTAIIIRDLHSKEYDYFERKFLSNNDEDCIKYCEMIPDQIMTDIYKKIVASRWISLEKKKRILPSAYLAGD
jgi:hypothetical protein